MDRSSFRRSSFYAQWVALLLAGCPVGEPMVMPPDQTLDTSVSRWADGVLAITAGSVTMSCTEDGVPTCGTNPQPQPGDCGMNPALGPNDGMSFMIQPLGNIQLGFFCSTIVEVGVMPGATGASDDFVIWGSVVGNARPVVEVGEDGSSYTAVNYWPQQNGTYVTNPGFQLEVPMYEAARFVRISEGSGEGMLQIDAVEARPRPE